MSNDRLRFRVWNQNKKQYDPNDNLVIERDGNIVEPLPPIYGDISFTYPTDNLIVEQCTGLIDANGKLIYEGDIICGKNPEVFHEVVFDGERACFRAELLPKPKHLMQNSLYSTPSQQWINEFSKRIIGNIHENPELLEEQK